MSDKKRLSDGTLRDKDRRLYCGAYHLKARDVRAFAVTDQLAQISSCDVIHKPEEGQIAHVAFRALLRSADDTEVEGTKTAIVDRLWNACSGPLRHVCDEARALPAHPSHLLPTGPRGVYVDRRSYLSRVCMMIKCHLCTWLYSIRECLAQRKDE